MVRKMPETETIAGQIGNNDDLFDLMIRFGRPIEGGSGAGADKDLFAAMMVSTPEGKNLFGRAVDGVARGLKFVGKWLYDNSPLLKAHDRRADSVKTPKAAEPVPVLVSNVTGLGQAAAASREAKPAGADVTPYTAEEARRRSENSWLGKNLRERLAKAPKVDKAALADLGFNVATLAAGIGIGYLGTGSGAEAMLGMELRGAVLAGIGQLGIIVSMRSERAIEGIPEAESRYARVVQSLQRGCANHAVLGAFRTARNLGLGSMAGSGFHYAVEMLSAGQQVAAGAPAAEVVSTPAPTEVSSPVDVARAIGDTRGEEIKVAQEGAQLAGQHAEVVQQQIANTVSQSMNMLTEANNVVVNISPDVVNDPSVQQSTEQARQAIEAYNQFNASAAAGGFDASEAARLQQMAADAMNAAYQVADTASQVAQQIAEAAQAAADAAAATEAARQAAETLASTPVAEIGRNLAGGGTVWGNELVFAQSLGLDHAVPVANAMKNFAYVFTEGQLFTGIGPESSVNLLNRNVATWLAGQLDGIIGQDPNTLNPFQKMIWEIGYVGRQASATDLAKLAKEYALQTVH